MSNNWHWALTQYVRMDAEKLKYIGLHCDLLAVAESYGNGCIAPRWPDGLDNPTVDETGQVKDVWGLVKVHHLNCEAAETDPRVQPYHTVYDPITPETVAAYQGQGA